MSKNQTPSCITSQSRFRVYERRLPTRGRLSLGRALGLAGIITTTPGIASVLSRIFSVAATPSVTTGSPSVVTEGSSITNIVGIKVRVSLKLEILTSLTLRDVLL